MTTYRSSARQGLLLVLLLLAATPVAVAQPLGPGTWEASSVAALERGPAGSWDSLNVTHLDIVQVGDQYYMFYTGTSDSTYWRGWGVHQIGLATSHDGATWTKYAGNPVLSGGDEAGAEGFYANTPGVYHEDGVFRLWYSVQLSGSRMAMALATSTDGIEWTKHGIVMWPGPDTFDERGLHDPMVLYEDGLYKMWYHAVSWNEWQVAYATSPDGINWTKYGVVIPRGFQGTLDVLHSMFPSVLRRADGYIMFYEGVWAPGYSDALTAFSTDGIHWTYTGLAIPDGHNPDLETLGGELRAYYTKEVDASVGHFDIYYAAWRPADTTPPVIVAEITGTLGDDGWYTSDVTLTWSVTDPESAFSKYACEAQSVTTDTAGVTFTCSATSAGGTSTGSVTVKRDTAGPSAACSVVPSVLWPANHKLWDVTATATASDALSAVHVTGLEVLSNEPDNGLGDGDTANDIQGFTPSLTTTGRLRAERAGYGSGRLYSIVFTVADEAGNTGTCAAYVKVPHDQGNATGKKK